MTALDAPLAHAAEGWPVFPVSARRIPMIRNWSNAATVDPVQIRHWWTASPFALIGTPTGERTGIAVLDVDRKNGKDGCRALAGFGYLDLPQTPTVLTANGGFHLHFVRPEGGFRNTVGTAGRGIGDGLDWRCDGGFVVLPAPGSGYRWGTNNYDNCALAAVPADLLPREPQPNPHAGRVASNGPTTNGLAGVARCLTAAKAGERNRLLFWAACRFAEAIAAGLIGEDDARQILERAAEETGLTADDGARAVRATINSAFEGAANG